MSPAEMIAQVLDYHDGKLRTRTTNPGSQQRYECECGSLGPWHFPNVDRGRGGYGSGDARPSMELHRHQAEEIVRALDVFTGGVPV
jgi:hypothetical protein